MEQPEKSVVEGKEQGEEEKGIAARLVPAEERKLQDVYVLGCYGVTMVLTLAMGFAAVASAKDLGVFFHTSHKGFTFGRRHTVDSFSAPQARCNKSWLTATRIYRATDSCKRFLR